MTLCYTSAQVCETAQISYRQLDYASHYLLQGQPHGRPGSGNRRLFTPEQTIRFMIVGTLLREGMLQEHAGRIAQAWDSSAMYYTSQREAVAITLNVGALWHRLNTLFPPPEREGSLTDDRVGTVSPSQSL